MSRHVMLAAIAMSLSMSLPISSPAFADGDAAKGEKVFAKCKACHENEKGVTRVGPTLKGIVGRATASVAGYKYSDAMAAKGAGGLVWTEDNLAAYLPDPKAFVPGTKMTFAGLKKPEDVADVIAYLKVHP